MKVHKQNCAEWRTDCRATIDEVELKMEHRGSARILVPVTGQADTKTRTTFSVGEELPANCLDWV